MLKNHFFVSQCDGSLYDTRKMDWIKHAPLRPGYAVLKSDVQTDNAALKAAIRAGFAWPGGYELFGVTQDGGTLCCNCMRKEYRQIAYSRRYNLNDGWRVLFIECAADFEGYISCDHCGSSIVEPCGD